MGKQAAAERTEVGTPTKKSKKKTALVDTFAEGIEPETPKTDKQNKHQKAKVEETADDKLRSEAKDVLDAEKRKRKEEKKKRKQAAAEEAPTVEEKAKEEAPRKKTKIESAAADEGTAEADSEAPKTQGASSASASGNELIVFVGNLPITCPEEILRKDFSVCGEIMSLKVPGKKKGRRIAFITYTCKEDVEKALELNASDYEGCTLRVNLSGKEASGEVALQVFVGGLPGEADEATVRQHFGECGEIASFLMPLSARNCSKGIAYITYKTPEGVDKALVFDGTEYGGRKILVTKADAETALKVNGSPEEISALKETKEKEVKEQISALKVFVGGLPFETDEATLRKKFGQCGEIASFKKIVPSNQRGSEIVPSEKKRDIVFITYKTHEGVDKALAFNGTDYEGCTLNVAPAGNGGGHKQKGKSKDGKGQGKDGKGKGKGKGKKGKKGQSK